MEAPAVWEGRKYKLETSVNFDEYMKAMGVGPILRKMGNTLRPIVQLEHLGYGQYRFTTENDFEKTKIQFFSGEDFDERTIDGRKTQSLIVVEGNCMLHEQKRPAPTSILREFGEDFMIATFQVGDVKAIRIYGYYDDVVEPEEENAEETADADPIEAE